MLNNNVFDSLCRQLFAVFPCSAPDVVAEEDWGEYGESKRIFSELGSTWNCDEVFSNRTILGFVNNAAFLFLLPRFIRCSLVGNVINHDILDYIVFALNSKIREFPTLFSSEQRHILLMTLRHLFSQAQSECSKYEPTATQEQRILLALEGIP